MKKTFKMYAICWAVLFVAFHVIAFVTPGDIAGVSKFSGSFWVGYAFIVLSFIGQLICAYVALKEKNAKKLFYRLPLITISYSATVVSVIVGALCMAIPFIPTWVGVVVCLLILAFSVVSVLSAQIAADLVEKTDDQIKAQTFFIKSLTADAQTLMTKAASEQAKAEVKNVYEAIRYSDPMSNDALSAIEQEIASHFAALSNAVEKNDLHEIKQAANDVLILVNNRSQKCKLLK